MKLLFRDISGPAAPSPGAGELYLQPSSPELQRHRNLATLIVQHGLACLQQGAGPIEAMVVRADPTLDDMLAAAFAGELLAGRPLPVAAAAFAEYAALVREGLTPGTVSLESSMQGIFKAIRSQAGDDLTVPENGEQFAADWSRMAGCILRSAAGGQDPFSTPPFPEGAEFARERIYLANDRAVYRQDVLRGEQWIVDIPGGVPGGRALILRQPKSLLYKHWSRSETDSGIGQPYVFLAVAEEPGNWVFSTDPLQKLQIQSLAESLQQAEAAMNPEDAARDPWFDGKPFGYTLVAAPRGRTKLPDREVLAIVRRWSHAQPIGRSRIGWKAAAVAAALLLLGLGIGFSRNWTPTRDPSPVADANKDNHRGDGDRRHRNDNNEVPLPPGGDSYALLFATQAYDSHPSGRNWPRLYNPKNDVIAIGTLLERQYGFIVNEYFDQSALEISKILRQWHDRNKYGRDSELLVFFAGHGYFDRGKNTGFVVARDSLCEASDPDDRNRTCLCLDTLSDELNKIPCRHTFLILDTCFGGTIDYGIAMRGGDDDSRVATEEYIAEKMQKKSRLFLASAGKDSVSDGPRNGHSPFAQKLLDFLGKSKKELNNGVVTTGLLNDGISWLKDERPKFGALLGNEGGDFLFVRKDP